MRAVVHTIDTFNEYLGRIVAWFALILVLTQFTVVVLRYVFGLGFIPMQESIVFMHAMLFLVAAGYTLLHDAHVRVDIFYGSASVINKARVNFFGVLVFLWPLCALLTWKSAIFVGASIRVWEGSPEGTFMPFWLLKSMLLVFPFVLSVQGISVLIRSWCIMTGREPITPIAMLKQETLVQETERPGV
jgi:TRAP-type mannitol/chloroaromatic compound transport system permease small subunit